MPKSPAVLSYPNSNNLGDYIQSIAAKQIINKSKILEIDRDELHRFKAAKVLLIMNGWFMDKPENWPPSDKIKPLFLSFHLNPTAEKEMLTQEGINYLKNHQPIGCRDYYTQKLLSRYGIKTYYSACLTLCLNRKNFVSKDTKREGIYVISPMERLNTKSESVEKSFFKQSIQQLKRPNKRMKFKASMGRLEKFLQKQSENIYYSSQLIKKRKHNNPTHVEKATIQLKNIAKAKLVITSRIHSALPAVAFGTPVLFLSDGLDHPNQKSRLDGMEQFFPVINSKELYRWDNEFPKPLQNHLPYVKLLTNQINHFLKE